MKSRSPVIFLSDISTGANSGGEVFEIQILKEGHWTYQGDPLDVTKNTLSEFKQNFDKRLYYPVPVDGPSRGGVAHSDNDLHDCGFVEALNLKDSGKSLWATVRVTNPDVASMVDEGSLGYCSSEFMLGWTEPAQDTSLNVLSGLGLTNRPFIKNMAPARRVQTVNFSEIIPKESNMNETNDIEALKAEVVKLKETATAQLALSEELTKLEAEKAVLLQEKATLSIALKAREQAGVLEGFYAKLKSKMDTNASLTADLGKKFMQLAETIVQGGVRNVSLSDNMDGSDSSIYHDTGQNLRKCDLIDMLTETINALPGDMVYVRPTGKGSGDTSMVDSDGQSPGIEDGSDSDSSGGNFKFSERFVEVAPRHRAVTQEILLAEVTSLMAKDKSLSSLDATKSVMVARGIKNFSEVN